MTLSELYIELSNYLQMDIDPDTPVVVCDTDFDPDPDPDVKTIFYCEERDRVCITIR